MTNVDKILIDREFYKLKNGVMNEHSKGFEFKWGSNRIYCAKVLQNGEYQWIRWGEKQGYDLNSIKGGTY